MKFILLFLNLFLINVVTGQATSNFISGPEPGKIYNQRLIAPFSTPFIYKEQSYVIRPTIWEPVLDTIYFDKEIQEAQRVMTREATRNWEIYKKEMPRRCIGSDPKSNLIIALVEIPATFKTIPYNPRTSYEIIEIEKVISESVFDRIAPIDNERSIPKDSISTDWMHDQNTYIKLTAGRWSEWREVVCADVCPSYSIRQIQEKLKEKGYYNGPTDNILNKETKAALTKFVRDNSLPSHFLPDVLRLLEID